jgi:UDP-N-acetylbacillosamine N-acetyltransferase
MIIKKEIIIMGAGGQTRSLIPLLIQNNYSIHGILDETFDSAKQESILNVKLIGAFENYKYNMPVVLAIGDNTKRMQLFERFRSDILRDNLCHTTSFIDPHAVVGNSNQIFGRCFINSKAIIGENNILNTGSILEHEVEIGSHNHISVGSILCGRVTIGDRCFIGAGAVVIDKLNICSDVTVGANTVVIDHITDPGVYVGNPARKIK